MVAVLNFSLRPNVHHYAAAGLHHSVEAWRKPFNPILGETWQATMPGGLCLFMEQVRSLGGTLQLLGRLAGAPAETL
jgi:hypothetical protein